MVEYKSLLTEEERFNLVAEEYFEAVEYEDWEKVASLITESRHYGRRAGTGLPPPARSIQV